MKNLQLSDLENIFGGNIFGGNIWQIIVKYRAIIGECICCTIIIAEIIALQCQVTYLAAGSNDSNYKCVYMSQTDYNMLNKIINYCNV